MLMFFLLHGRVFHTATHCPVHVPVKHPKILVCPSFFVLRLSPVDALHIDNFESLNPAKLMPESRILH